MVPAASSQKIMSAACQSIALDLMRSTKIKKHNGEYCLLYRNKIVQKVVLLTRSRLPATRL